MQIILIYSYSFFKNTEVKVPGQYQPPTKSEKRRQYQDQVTAGNQDLGRKPEPGIYNRPAVLLGLYTLAGVLAICKIDGQIIVAIIGCCPGAAANYITIKGARGAGNKQDR